MVTERANLIGPSRIPGFSNDLCIRKKRIFTNGFDQRRIRNQITVTISTENGGQIKTKSVNVIVVHPVPQAVKNHLANDGVISIDRVSATRIVFVVLRIRFQHVVHGVFQALETQYRSLFVAFASVIEHHIENDFDPRLMQSFDHLLEFGHLAPWRCTCRIPSMWGKKCHRVVTPVVGIFWRVAIDVENRKFMDGHELDRGYPKVLEIRNLLNDPEIGPWMLDTAGRTVGKAANMQLINDTFGQFAFDVSIPLPVEKVVNHDTLWGTDNTIGGLLESASKSLGIGVD